MSHCSATGIIMRRGSIPDSTCTSRWEPETGRKPNILLHLRLLSKSFWWRPSSGWSIFKDRRFREGRKSRVFGEISGSCGTMIRPDGLCRGHLYVLDIETRRKYPFHVKGGTDSDLNGREIRTARKSKSLYHRLWRVDLSTQNWKKIY